MKTNKLDNSIKNKLKDRTFEPSASAWERLSAQLDEQPKDKKRGWFFYIGYAASILLLVSIGIQLFSNTDDEFPTKDEIVLEQIDKDLIDKNLEKLKNEIPVEKAIVKNDAVEEQQEGSSIIKKNVSLIGVEKTKKPIFIKNQDKIIIAKTDFNKNINIITRKEESHKKETKTIIAKDDSQRRLGLTHAPPIGNTTPQRRVKFLLPDNGASFERRVCSIEVKWASVEEKC